MYYRGAAGPRLFYRYNCVLIILPNVSACYFLIFFLIFFNSRGPLGGKGGLGPMGPKGERGPPAPVEN
jgi:hypothetical protein